LILHGYDAMQVGTGVLPVFSGQETELTHMEAVVLSAVLVPLIA